MIAYDSPRHDLELVLSACFDVPLLCAGEGTSSGRYRPEYDNGAFKSRARTCFRKDQAWRFGIFAKFGRLALTDDGVAQRLRLEADTDLQPLALVVVVQTGGLGASHLGDYRGLEATLEAIIGAVQHRVSVVSFDSHVRLEQGFDPETNKAAEVIAGLEPGDQGAAILDGVTFAAAQLAKQPARYRRALLLFSETSDSGSQASLDDTLRAVDDTNAAIYSFALSSAKAALKHEGAKLPRPYVQRSTRQRLIRQAAA